MGELVATERISQFGSRGDPELGEDVLEVGADRAVREEELLADIPIGEPFGGEQGDLEFLRRELVAHYRRPPPTRLSGGAQFLPRQLAPGGGTQSVEGLAGHPQWRARFAGSALAAQPDSAGELQARPEEGPRR